MNTFEELDCWKKSAALTRKLSSLVKTLPIEERFKLTDQILRAKSGNIIEDPQITYDLSEVSERITDNV
jgi:23S rRNA-intervening sequence protein